MPTRCRMSRVKYLVVVLTLIILLIICLHINRREKIVRRDRTADILLELGSRDTKAFVKPAENTILLDATIREVSGKALSMYQELDTLVHEKHLCKTGENGSRENDSRQETPFAVVVVLSQFGFRENRQAIRDSWYQWAKEYNLLVVFFLGLLPNGRANMTEVLDEIRDYHDVVIDNHIESYYLLAIKMLRVLKWYNTRFPDGNMGPKFLVKTDHDVFIHIPNLVTRLGVGDIPYNPEYIAGELLYRRRPDRGGYDLWTTPKELWGKNIFPIHASGMCYVIAGTLVVDLYEEALEVRLFHMENVFLLGMVATKRLDIPIQALGKFLTQANEVWGEVRVNKYVAIHPVDPSKMTKYYNDAMNA